LSEKTTKGFSDADEFVSEIFHGISVKSQTLSNKLFEDCGFIGCDFSDATLSNCKFVDCTFTNCNCCNLRIHDTRFANIEFIESKLLGIDWTRAKWPRIVMSAPLKFHKSVISDCTFFGLTLEETVIEECKAHGVDFREANFARSNFRHTDFLNALFGKTSLEEADFSFATNYSIDVFENRIERGRFSRDEALSLLDSLGIELVD
jgi:uncharacterized protein YjbI with pentapeptide repeats